MPAASSAEQKDSSVPEDIPPDPDGPSVIVHLKEGYKDSDGQTLYRSLGLSAHMTMKDNMAMLHRQMNALEVAEQFPPPNVHGAKRSVPCAGTATLLTHHMFWAVDASKLGMVFNRLLLLSSLSVPAS